MTAALLVTASCSSDPPVNNCFDGKCDGTGTDPFKGLGDIESRTFEYIIIGSGAGGGPLAANLARQGHSVLLLEAGKETGGKTESSVPVLHPTSTETPDLAWWYFVNHYSDKNRQALDTKNTTEGILYPRGGVLGGSTAVNALITVAPKNSDWDQIASLTNDTSWRASNMAQYYERVQHWLSVEHQQVDLATLVDTSIGAILAGTFMFAADHGIGGPHVDPDNPLANVAAMFEFLLHDINAEIMAGPGTQGVFMFPLATKDHKRNGTREYLLRTMRDSRHFPLRIKTQALVTKVTFDGKDGSGNWRANGVDFLDGESLYGADLTAANAPASPKLVHAKASKEVIVAAGAFNTPQLLMLSGIGDEAHLKSKGIDVKVPNSAVGTNLQDRYEVGVVSELSTDFTAVQRCSFSYDENDRCYRDWLLKHGPYTSNGSVLSILMKSDPNKPESDLHIFALPGVFKGYYPGYSTDANKDLHHLSWVILKGHTQNTAGTVRLKSADPRERPDINFHYFDDGSVDQGQDVNDLTALVNAVEFVRDLASRSDTADKFTTYTERWPGGGVQSRAQIGDWIKKEAWGHHASCSAPIGKVLESDFRVKGTANLRVVDASVFPKIPGTFIVLPIYMVSEKAFDVILKKNNEQRKTANFL